jgi:glyoxylate reductase
VAYQILVQSDVEMYEAVLPLLSDSCEIHLWPEQEPPVDTDYAAIEGLYVYGHMWLDGALMERMPRLRVISNFGVGCDHIDLDGARRLGIPVGNTPGVLDATTADMTFTLLMAAARNVVRGDHFARGPDFVEYDPSFMLGQEVAGSTLGIVGLGRIGYQVARRASGFDMEILYHNRNPNRRAEEELGARYVSLEELMSTADFAILTMPLTRETRGMIGRRELGLMKPTAVLVNAARGAVLDHEALLAALQEKRIHAAALDVTEPEPLPRDHPLLAMENVIIMPHLGSATVQTRDAMARMSVENLMAGLEGREVPYRIV